MHEISKAELAIGGESSKSKDREKSIISRRIRGTLKKNESRYDDDCRGKKRRKKQAEGGVEQN